MAKLTAIHVIHRRNPKSKQVIVVNPGEPLEADGDELTYLLDAGAARLAKGPASRVPAATQTKESDSGKSDDSKGSDKIGADANKSSGKPDGKDLVG